MCYGARLVGSRRNQRVFGETRGGTTTRIAPLVAGLIVLSHLALAARLIVTYGLFGDEPGHLASGLEFWQTGRGDGYAVNPPLTRTLFAIPATWDAPELEWEYADTSTGRNQRVEFGLGHLMIREYPNWERAGIAGKFLLLPFALLASVAVFCCGRELWSGTSGLLALAIWCFHPVTLTWASSGTVDMATAALWFTTFGLLINTVDRDDVFTIVLLGLVLGISLLTRHTLLMLALVIPAVRLGVIVFELVLGLWLISGIALKYARDAALATFILFIGVSLIRVATGESTCGCFGAWSVYPVWMIAVNASVLIWLLLWQPLDGPTVPSRLRKVPALAA